MSTLKTNKVESTTPGGDCIVKATNNLSNRNIIVNGACNVAQRGTSSTSSGYHTVDRMNWGLSGHSVTVTQSQHALTSSDTGPWEKGFRNSAHIALSGAGTMAANTTMSCFHKIEAQDIANSGWDYTSASSYITLSFWFKVSTAQTFYLLLFTSDGTAKSIVKAFTPGNTNWNKFTFTIPGASGLQFDDDEQAGLNIGIVVTYGTDKTGSGNNLDSWGNYDSSERVPDMASTWLTAGASTYEFTGLQLEVGDVATDFEHRSYGDDLTASQRYYYNYKGDNGDSIGVPGCAWGTTTVTFFVQHPVAMRANPSIEGSGNCRFQSSNDSAAFAISDFGIQNVPTDFKTMVFNKTSTSSATEHAGGSLQMQSDSAILGFNAEL